MSKKFTVEKQVDYKNGVVDTWYMIKLEQTDADGYTTTQFVDCCKDDEAKALEAKRCAEEAMQNRGTDFDLALAQSEFAMAAAQLAAIARFRRKK